MELFYNFYDELKRFSKSNWWAYLIYASLMVLIIRDADPAKVVPIFTMNTIHFIADIFIMMMMTAYGRKEYRRGTYFQLTSLVLFMSLKLYTAVNDGHWNYICADPVYLLAAVKNYYHDVRHKEIEYINYKTLLILSAMLILVLSMNQQALAFPRLFQTCGIFLFAVALSITGQERFRYYSSIVSLMIMTAGSAWVTYDSVSAGKIIDGLALSYFILPLTVLVYFLRNWKPFMKAHPPIHTTKNPVHLINPS